MLPSFNPFMPNALFYLISLNRCIFYIRSVWLDSIIIIIVWFTEISELYANSEDPDQTPQYAASDQVLHCLPMSPIMGR